MAALFTTDNLISFIILVVLEVVLGIDNVIFVSIIMNRLREDMRKRARFVWMAAGMLTRIALLFGLSWLLQQKGKPIFTLYDKSFDLASLIMLIGGLFLMYKSVKEIHHKLEGEELSAEKGSKKGIGFAQAMGQIILIDMIFSFDSIITAGGTAKRLEIMIAAVVIAMIVMFLFSSTIASFIHKHPTLKMLARSFVVDTDEGVRADTSIEALAKLKPAFAQGGSVTAGNSSQTSDGAAFAVIMSERMMNRLGLQPIGRLVSCVSAGVPPRIMGIGPVAAIPKVLKQAGMSIDQIDLMELNEAFAAQALAVIRTLELNPDIININGGAIALGHPLGCTGCKLTVQLLHDMKRLNKKYGMVTACVGGGQGIAGIIENIA